MINVKILGMKESIEIWGNRPVEAAMKKTFYKIVRGAMTRVSAQIRKIYNIKKQDIDKKMDFRVAGSSSAWITASGKGISLSYFGAKQFFFNKTITRYTDKDGDSGLKRVTRKKSHAFQGVEVEVVKGHKTRLKSAFLAQMSSGHIGVMHRWGAGVKMKSNKKKVAIGEKGVISLAVMIQGNNISEPTLKYIREDWDEEFEKQLKYELSKASGKS